MAHCATRLGDAYFRTPRTTITAFINLLSVLEQNPGIDWKELIGELQIEVDHGGVFEHALEVDDEFASFQL